MYICVDNWITFALNGIEYNAQGFSDCKPEPNYGMNGELMSKEC